MGLGGRDHLVTAPDRGDHLEVVVERKQRGKCASNQLLVIGDQQTDRHVTAPRANETRSRHPFGSSGPASTTPPAAAARSRSPVRPFPGPPCPGPPFWPTPSSTISTEPGDRRTEHELACEWRTTFVSPSRTTQPNSS